MLLVDCRSSEDFTAKCRGVNPFESLALTSTSHDKMYDKASSAPENAAQ